MADTTLCPVCQAPWIGHDNDTCTTIDALAEALGDLLRRGNDVRDWPTDEADWFRAMDYRSFEDRADKIDAFRRRKAARLILAALPGLGYVRPREVCTGGARCEAPTHVHGCFADHFGACDEPAEHVADVEHEWAVRVDGGPMDGQVLPQGAEVIARDTVRRIVSGTGVLLRRPIARGPWEEVPRG